MPEPIQILAERMRNQETMEVLSPELVIAQYLLLPGLRGFWPMSSISYQAADQVRDLSGAGLHLTNNNVSLFGYDNLAPYAEFDGVNQNLSRADGGAANWADILGTEAYILAAQRGLTMAGWFRADALIATMNLMGKTNGALAGSSYLFNWRGADANDPLQFAVSDGVGFFTATINNLTTATWYFIAGRYTPSVEVKLWANTTTNSVVAGIPAALQDTATAFSIGAYGSAAQYFDGRASMCFLCAAALSDEIIQALYYQSKGLFGV